MKNKILLLTAAMAVALTACGPKEQEDETVPTDAPAPSAEVQVPTKAPDHTEPPAETPEALPEPTPEATPAPADEAGETPAPQESAAQVPPAESAAPEDVDPLVTPEATEQSQRNAPSDEEILNMYREADEAYRWFAVCTLPGDMEDSRTVDDLLYTRVADPRFPTMDSFRAYLKTLFSDEIVDGLLPFDGKQYVELDGGLYVSEGARGADTSKGGVTLMVVWPEGETPMSCTVQAVVELLDWPEGTNEPVVSGQQTYEFPCQKVGDKWVFTQFESIF